LLTQPDYDDIEEGNDEIKPLARGKSDKGKDNKKYGELMRVAPQLIKGDVRKLGHVFFGTGGKFWRG
jgi:hypothetical protein